MGTTSGGTRRMRAASAVLAAGFLLSACGGGDDATEASGGKTAPGPNVVADRAGGGGGERSSTDGGGADDKAASRSSANNSARVLPAPRDIIYRGDITVRVKNVVSAAARAEQIARAANGEVFAEETSTDAGAATSRARLTLRVPPHEFRSAMADIGRLGKRLHQSQKAQDVTTQVVDIESRIATQKRSVARVRALLDEAKTIGEVVQVESELARREADLESLQAQLARLEDVTELATIEVSLVGPNAAAPKPKHDDLGFLAGFRGGWEALVQVMVVGLTVLGALLPFALAATLVALPTWLLLRSRLRRRGSVVTPEASAT